MRHTFLHSIKACFPRAAAYREAAAFPAFHESAAPVQHFPYQERHLQCLWADPRHRPPELKTTDGEPVIIEHPGDWNLEAGPDFLNAALLIGKEKRRVTGDLEIHIHANAWNRHGHEGDPRYSGVRFHVVYFQGAEINGLIQIPLQETLAADPRFSFDNIDTTAFPYSIPAGAFPLLGIDPDLKIEILEAAGEERLLLKAERFALAMQTREPEQVLWEELMAALGYKNNKAPFRQLGAVLPQARLHAQAATPGEAYAILLGLSGLLPKNPAPRWPSETKTFIRSIWDLWWKQPDALHELALEKSDWVLAGIRPANHPVRRLMAAAHYAFAVPGLAADEKSLTEFPDNFWSTHISWKARCAPTALVGQPRANAIITNILIPYRAASGKEVDLNQLPPEPSNAIIRQTAFSLFGPDHTPKVYQSALARQGLIHIFHAYLITHRLEELRNKFGGAMSALCPGGTLSPMSADSAETSTTTADEDVSPPEEYPSRKHPAHHPPIENPNKIPIIFLTVCTHNRQKILDNETMHNALEAAWLKSDQWIVGRYIIMPDHTHLFCSPAAGDSVPVDQWTSYWKRLVSQQFPNLKPIWQRDCRDTQLRNHESYSEKWSYVENNPVRAGLVEHSGAWPYQGTINHLPW